MDQYEKQRFAEFWEKKRALGQWQYVLREGLIMLLILLVVSVLVDLFDNMSFREALVANTTPANFLFKVLLSIGYAFFMWYRHEKLYRKIRENP